MGLFWFAAGIGSFVGIALPHIFRESFWRSDRQINCDRLDIYLAILALFLLISLVFFGVVNRCSDLGLDKAIVTNQVVKDTQSVPSTPQALRREQSFHRSYGTINDQPTI